MSRTHAIAIFSAAVDAVKPDHLMRQHIDWDGEFLKITDHRIHEKEFSRLIIIAAGKAASLMAQTAETIAGNIITEGVVVTKYDHALPLKKLRQMEAGHPLPDENSLKGGEAVLDVLKNRSHNDIVLALISGGASALLADTPAGVSLQDLQTTFQLLLESGATIHQMNIVRKHLSNIKGGWLAVHAQPAKLFTLILSDVVGDDLDIIASGPTVPDKSSFSDAVEILNNFQLMNRIPVSVQQHLAAGFSGKIQNTPKADHPAFRNTINTIIGSNPIALQAAAQKAVELGYQTTILSSGITGEAREVARSFTEELKKTDSTQPVCLLMGGETTVTIRGNGRGGRNQEFALAAAMELAETRNITILSGGSDGSDGPTDAAGAVVDGHTLRSAIDQRMNMPFYLKNNDSYHFFEKVGGLIKTGPTQTNVMDLMIGLKK